MSYIFSDDQVMNALREVVAENPDKVYQAPEHMKSFSDDPSCFYAHANESGGDLKPGCVVGHVLHRLGVSLDDLTENEGLGAHAVVPALGIKGVSEEMGLILRRVQRLQDQGDSWGLAYEKVTGQPVPKPAAA